VPLQYEGQSLLEAQAKLARFSTEQGRRWVGLRDGRWKLILDEDSGVPSSTTSKATRASARTSPPPVATSSTATAAAWPPADEDGSEAGDVEPRAAILRGVRGGLAVPGGLGARRGASLDVEEPEQAQIAVVADALAADETAAGCST
jgi:hypothetical protein